MNWPDIYLLCFAVGVLWSIASLVLGGMHLGHGGHMHAGHGGHMHAGHGGHMHAGHASHAHSGGHSDGALKGASGRFASLVNPSCAAIFLAWFGGIGYLLTRHSGLTLWLNLTLAALMGLGGAWLLALFLNFLQSREQPLDPADYEMVGVLGQVSCRIRPEGVGELVFVRDGARRPVPARSEEGTEIERGREVIVTRYEKGIAYVRTWEAMTQ